MNDFRPDLTDERRWARRLLETESLIELGETWLEAIWSYLRIRGSCFMPILIQSDVLDSTCYQSCRTENEVDDELGVFSRAELSYHLLAGGPSP